MRLTGMFAGLALLAAGTAAHAAPALDVEVTGKDGGQAFIEKGADVGPLNYEVCGTCPIGLCSLEPDQTAVRVFVTNNTLGKVDEKESKNKTKLKYQQQGGSNKGPAPDVSIEYWVEGELANQVFCDGDLLKKGDIKVDVESKKLKGSGKAKVDFPDPLVQCEGWDTDTVLAVTALCSNNKVVKFGKNGKNLKLNVRNGGVTGIGLNGPAE